MTYCCCYRQNRSVYLSLGGDHQVAVVDGGHDDVVAQVDALHRLVDDVDHLIGEPFHHRSASTLRIVIAIYLETGRFQRADDVVRPVERLVDQAEGLDAAGARADGQLAAVR